MFGLWVLSLVVSWGTGQVAATPAPRGLFGSPYAPAKGDCPADPMLRPAKGLSDAEKAFVEARKPQADEALSTWLSSIDPKFESQGGSLPSLAFLSSGGGHRSFLTSAGLIQAMDSRENNSPLGGLWQSMIYHAGNSGGSWLVSAMAANGWSTVSDMMQSGWSNSLSSSLLTAGFSLTNPSHLKITHDLIAKKQAGYQVVLNDIWGRLLSYQFLQGDGGDVGSTFSGIADSSAFASNDHPLPILVALNVDLNSNNCTAGDNAIHVEFTPYEFGSWDDGIAAFTPTKYLGTELSNGRPSNDDSGSGTCTTGFDNVGYMLGASSDYFNVVCYSDRAQPPSLPLLKGIFEHVAGKLTKLAGFANFPNPFHQSSIEGTDPTISQSSILSLADGGEENENNPIWPFLKSDRPVDVLFVNDNSADKANYPSGNTLYHTSQKAQAAGLKKMPKIPEVSYFDTLKGRPTFFGCKDPEQLTLIYLQNKEYTFNSGQGTFKLTYTAEESASMIQNGNAVATLNGDKEWPTCVACAVMQKSNTTLPAACTDCLNKYCYN